MIVNYFDLGLWKYPHEIEMMLQVMSKVDANFNIYGFEANPEYAIEVQERYKDVDYIKIYNLAISDHNGQEKIFLDSNTGLGCSIFRSKKNATDYYYDVEGVLFSDWVSKNVTNIKEAVNVLKINIEGAELYLFRDLISSGLIDDIHIFAGHHSHDILKVGELQDHVDEYFKLIENIKIHKFCGEVQGYDNVDMAALIMEQIEKQIV